MKKWIAAVLSALIVLTCIPYGLEPQPVQATTSPTIDQLSTNSHTLALDNQGQVWAWGSS